jgi:hypothetical protein
MSTKLAVEVGKLDLICPTIKDSTKCLRNIKHGGRFIVDNNMQLSFDQSNTEKLCDVPTSLYINKNLKYFMQILGCDGMSTSWSKHIPMKGGLNSQCLSNSFGQYLNRWNMFKE